MAIRHLIRQGYRLYAIATSLWVAFSILWYRGLVGLDSTQLGYGWSIIAVAGVIIAASLLSKQRAVFEGDDEAQTEFDTSTSTNIVLPLYVLGLVSLSGISIAWYTTAHWLVAQSVLGYAWAGFAAIGTLLALGLVTKHADVLTEATVSTSSTDQQL